MGVFESKNPLGLYIKSLSCQSGMSADQETSLVRFVFKRAPYRFSMMSMFA